MYTLKRYIAFFYLIIFGIFAISPLLGSADDSLLPTGHKAKPSAISMRIFYLDSFFSAVFDDDTGPSNQDSGDDGDGDFLIKKARAIPKFVDLDSRISSVSRTLDSYLSLSDSYYFAVHSASIFQFADDAVPGPRKGYAASYSGLSPPHFLFS